MSGDATTLDPKGAPRFCIPDHTLLRKIGEGAYGEVWLACNVMGAWRAVKVVFRDRFRDGRPYEREFEGIRRFEPISRSHDGFVDVLQVGRNDGAGYFYYVMELADDERGGPLVENPLTYAPRTLASDLREQGHLPGARCLTIGLSLSSALEHLHAQGLIHRDIKPGNIIFINGQAKLADIGLVTTIRDSVSFVGSPGYIAPEGPGSPTADIYSLGKVLYEISTGEDREDFPNLPPDLLAQDGAAELLELNEVVVKACAHDPRLRYASAEALHADLLLLQGGKSVKRLRALEQRLAWLTRLLALGAAGALLISIVAFQIVRENRRRAEERQRQAGAYVVDGTRAMEDGDLVGALHWFSEALHLDEGDPARRRTHQLRIGLVLERCPKPVQIWSLPVALAGGEFCPTREEVLLTDAAGRIHVRHSRTGQPVAAWSGFQKVVGQAAYSHDGRWIVTGGLDPDAPPVPGEKAALARVWDATNGQLRATVRLPAAVASAQFNHAGDLLVVACADHSAYVVDWATGQTRHTLARHTDGLLFACFSPDDSRIVTAGKDELAIVWNAMTGQPSSVPPLRHSSWVYHADFSADGKLLATACFDRTARVWDTATGQPTGQRPMEHRDGVRSAVFSPAAESDLVLTACLDSSARLWHRGTGQPAAPILKHSGRVMAANFSPDGRRILTVCYDGAAYIWRLPDETLPPATRVVYSPDGLRFANFSGDTIRVADALASNTVATLTTARPISSAQFSQHGEVLLTVYEPAASRESSVTEAQLWSVAQGRPLGRLLHLDGKAEGAALSPAGQSAALWSRSQLQIWAADGGPPVRLALAGEIVHGAEFDPTGERLVLTSGVQARVWSAVTGQPLTPPLRHPEEVSHAEFSPDGHWLVTACAHLNNLSPCLAQVWDAATGQPLGAPLRHRDGVLFARFSPDSQRVVTASEDFSAVIWDARTGRQLTRPLEHGDQVHYAAFSQDGRWLVTAGQDRVARLWDTATGEPLSPPLRHPSSLRFAQIVANDTRVLTRNSKGDTRVWNLPHGECQEADLTLIAQLLSGQQRDRFGTMIPQTREALRQKWEFLRAHYPAEFSMDRP